MRKKFLSALMLGLLAIGTTSTITSCKDYDGDISSLRNDVTELQNARKTLESDVANLKTQLEAAQANIKSLQTDVMSNATKIATNAANIQKEYERALAAESALEQRIKSCEDAIKDLDALTKALEQNKLDKSEFTQKTQEMMEYIKAELAKKADITYVDAAVLAINNQIKTLDDKIGDLDKNLSKKISDEEAARIQAIKNLQDQIDALDKYKARVEANEKNIKDLQDAVKKAQEDISTNAGNISTNAGNISTNAGNIATNAGNIKTNADNIAANAKSIKEILDEIKTLKEQMEQAQNDIKANASSINDLTKKMQTLNNTVNDIQSQVNVLTVLINQELRSIVFDPQSYYWGIEATEAATLKYDVYALEPANADKKEGSKTEKYYSERFPSTAGSTALPVVASYYMNPSSASKDNIKDVTVLSDDKDYVVNRGAAAGINVAKWDTEAGMLKVTLKFNNPDAIMSINANEKVTVFASQATVRSGAKDTTITSDWAAIIKSTIQDLSIAVINPISQQPASCEQVTCEPTHQHPHIYATEQEAADADPQYTVKYNSTLDLSTLVETHYNNGTGYAKFDKMADYGLAYKYELVGYYRGSNETSESAHAAINGNILRPQMPKWTDEAHTQGVAAAYEATSQDETSCGRMPMVRVSLIDTNNDNRVVQYGYIKLEIVKNDQPGPDDQPANAIVMKDFDGITYNYECDPAKFEGILTWAQVESWIYNLYHLSRTDFDLNYEKDLNGQDFKQYAYDSKKKEYVEVTNYIGVISPVLDPGRAETEVAKWAISSAEIKKLLTNNDVNALFAEKTPYNTGDKINVYFRYKSLNPQKYGDIYVNLSTGAITLNKPSAKGLVDENKIAENWYTTNSSVAKSGYDEVHAQTLSPEDPYSVAIAEVLNYNIYNVFVGNQISIAPSDPASDLTKLKEFSEGNSLFTKKVIFSDKNIGKVYNGILNNEVVKYTIGVANENKQLTVTKKDGVAMTPVVFAEISQDGDGRDIVEYLHTEEGEAMLNYAAHNALADDVLTAIMQVKAASECFNLPLDKDTWNVRFLRPIDVASNGAEVTDAGTAAQIVNLRELVKFNDWREQWNPAKATKDYYAYYNIKSIEVIGATAEENIAPYVKANLNQASKDTYVKLSTITKQIRLNYYPVTPGTPAKDADYGKIVYENHGNTVADFDVLVPVVVSYEWGKIYTEVKLHVNGTIGGNSAK